MSAADIDSDFEGDSGLIVDNDGGKKQQTGIETKIDGEGVMFMSFIVQILITIMSSQLFVHTYEQRCAVAN